MLTASLFGNKIDPPSGLGIGSHGAYFSSGQHSKYPTIYLLTVPSIPSRGCYAVLRTGPGRRFFDGFHTLPLLFSRLVSEQPKTPSSCTNRDIVKKQEVPCDWPIAGTLGDGNISIQTLSYLPTLSQIVFKRREKPVAAG